MAGAELVRRVDAFIIPMDDSRAMGFLKRLRTLLH